MSAGLIARPAVADSDDPFNLVFGGSVTRDSNLMRLPAAMEPPAVVDKPTRSDVITDVHAGLRVDKPYAQQRFQLEATRTAYRFDHWKFLDFDALDHREAWLWHATPRLSGTASASHTEVLVPFTDFRLPVRNIRTTDNRVLTADGRLFGGWHVLLGGSEYEQKDDLTVQAVGSYRMNTGEAGIQYVAGSGSAIAFSRRSTRGAYLERDIDAFNLIDNGFHQDERSLTGTWKFTAGSTLTGRVTRLERRHDHFSERDFSGVAGEFGYSWTPSEGLRVDISALRDITSWQEAFSSYRVNATRSLAATWRATARTTLSMRIGRTDSDFRGPVRPPMAALRKDTMGNWQVGVDWTPLRSLTLGASVQHQYRSSNDADFAFDDSIASVRASLIF